MDWKKTFYVLLIIFILFFVAILSNEKVMTSGKVKTTSATPIIQTTIVTPIPTVVIQYDDDKYISWVKEIIENAPVANAGILTAIESQDRQEIKIYAKILKENYLRYKTESDTFKLSPAWKPFAEEFKKYLEDIYQSGRYLEIGEENDAPEIITDSANYTQKATAHLNAALKLLPPP